MRHHIDNQPEHAKYGDTAGGGDSDHLTILIWNAGNIDRPGIDPQGVCKESKIVPFITGKHHVALIQESCSERCWRDFNTFGFRYAFSAIKVSDAGDELEDGNLLILAGGSGRKNITVVEQQFIVNKLVSNPKKIAAERIWYTVAIVSWTDFYDPSITFCRAGKPKWIFATAHLHNTLASKPDASKIVLKEFWERMLSLEANIVGGDFNQGAYGRAAEALTACIGDQPIKFEVFQRHPKDCILVFHIIYPTDGPLEFTMSLNVRKITAYDLDLRTLDTDWHWPLLVTLRVPGPHKRKRDKHLKEALQPGLQGLPSSSSNG